MTVNHLRDTQDVVIQESSPDRPRAAAHVLRRNGGRYMLPRSPRTPTATGIEQVYTHETPDYVSTEGTVFFTTGGTSEFDISPVYCLGIAPFTVDMQGDSSPSKFPIRPFQPCLCLIADERDLDRFSRGLR